MNAVLYVICLFLFQGHTYALKCYECLGGSDCGSPKSPAVTRECDGSCSLVRYNDGTVRQCTPMTDEKEYCEVIHAAATISQQTVEECRLCQTNKCNGPRGRAKSCATVMRPSYVVVLELIKQKLWKNML